MMKHDQRRKAESLLALHNAPPILVLPNAWDAATMSYAEVNAMFQRRRGDGRGDYGG